MKHISGLCYSLFGRDYCRRDEPKYMDFIALRSLGREPMKICMLYAAEVMHK